MAAMHTIAARARLLSQNDLVSQLLDLCRKPTKITGFAVLA
jgi:hypothetical protein